MSAMFRSLSLFNYRLWFAGALVSNIGTWMQRTAQDWLVLTDLTDNDATALGITMALQFAPPILMVPITGLIADRFDRRRLLMVTQLSMGLLGLALGLLVLTDSVQLLDGLRLRAAARRGRRDRRPGAAELRVRASCLPAT
nr:hypothetical protein GCM10025699_77510 [Microbacterium flavescens]